MIRLLSGRSLEGKRIRPNNSAHFSLDRMEHLRPSGIGGWLLLFSVMLAIGIAFSFYNYAIAALIALRVPALFRVVLPYCILGVPVSLLGGWSVLLLFSRRPSAPFYVKLFLILYGVLNVLVSILAFRFAPSDIPPAISKWYQMLEFRAAFVVYSAVWFWYFSVSARVRNTYSDTQAI